MLFIAIFAANEVRTYTFGIGPLCNKYFLCQLAAAGRGYSDVCYYPDSIQSQMLALMGKTANPILANITLSFGVGMLQVEVSFTAGEERRGERVGEEVRGEQKGWEERIEKGEGRG